VARLKVMAQVTGAWLMLMSSKVLNISSSFSPFYCKKHASSRTASRVCIPALQFNQPMSAAAYPQVLHPSVLQPPATTCTPLTALEPSPAAPFLLPTCCCCRAQRLRSGWLMRSWQRVTWQGHAPPCAQQWRRDWGCTAGEA
jgi:hypothetical protein